MRPNGRGSVRIALLRHGLAVIVRSAVGALDILRIVFILRTVFAERYIKHLQPRGIDLSHVTWPSDNGAEFVGYWQAKDDSAFTGALQRIAGQVPPTIPPGQHRCGRAEPWRFHADVETVHNLMEQAL